LISNNLKDKADKLALKQKEEAKKEVVQATYANKENEIPSKSAADLGLNVNAISKASKY
jgi:hypothetical protein